MKRTVLTAVLVLTAATGGLFVGPGRAQADGCSTPWGSQAKTTRTVAHVTLTGVRAGRHACFDRVVLDTDRSGAGWSVRYVSAVRDQGRGAVVPLRGGAFLEVVQQSQATRRVPMPDVTGFTTLRQVGWGGSVEGSTTVGVGVRARLPFRVLTTDGRLVVDVAHHW